MDKRTFWATKSRLPEYHAVVFDHPAFEGPIRLVAEQFAPVVLGGQSHLPVPMTIKPPSTAGETAKLQLAFHRAVVGRDFKRQLARIRAAGSRSPILVTYSVYFDDLATPGVRWNLFAAESTGVSFTGQTVQVVATIDNPMRRNVSEIYSPDIYTGLELIS